MLGFIRLFFSEHFRYVRARRVALEQVSGVVFGACSAAAADFPVLANPAFAFYVAFVSEFEV